MKQHRLTPTLGGAFPDCTTACTTVPSQVVDHIDTNSFFDLVIIGAGPAALALVSRILEVRPAALYTEDEHRHLHWLKKAHKPAVLHTMRAGRSSSKYIVGQKDASSPRDQCECDGTMRILVLDKLGEGWLGSWNRAFDALDIQHLRSPMFFHPAPDDLDSLIAYAERTGRNTAGDSSFLHASQEAQHSHRGRTARRKASSRFRQPDSPPDAITRSNVLVPDLVEITGVVGKEVSKHRRASKAAACNNSTYATQYRRLLRNSGPAVNEHNRRDYYTPSKALFRDFINEDIVARYGLDTDKAPQLASEVLGKPGGGEATDRPSPILMLKGQVEELHYGALHVDGWEHLMGFSLRTADGCRVGAKAVVSAIGPGGMPAVPEVLLTPSQRRRSASPAPAPAPTHGPGWCHSSAIASPAYAFPPPELASKMADTACTVVVIGGGLTSAQVVKLAIQRGAKKVVLLLRGHFKVKPFDIDLSWMGRYSNLEKMRFWQEEDLEERLRMLRGARQGGSITPGYARLLRSFEASGLLEIRTFTEIERAHWNGDADEWSLELKTVTSPSKATAALSEDAKDAQFPTTSTFQADFCIAATGPRLDFASIPFLRSISNTHPIAHIGGLPMVTEDLQWRADVPLFLTGAASALQVGPAAFNLGGMREAADRIALRLQHLSLAPEGGVPTPPTPALVPSDEAEQGSLAGDDIEEELELEASSHPLSRFTHFGFESLSLA